MSTVSVVTGANKGVGFGTVRALCKQLGGTVILAARDVGRGEAAVARLRSEGLDLVFEQLDICDAASVERFRSAVEEKYGGIDVLCNNAGIAYKNASTAPALEKATATCATNFIATAAVTRALLPVMKPGGRICQVASMAGILSHSFAEGNSIRARLLDPSLTEDQLIAIHGEYIEAVRNEDYSLFPNDAAYRMSKVLLIAHTRVMARELAADARGILINCCCPGYVDTDMSSHKGPLTIDQGAVTPTMTCLIEGKSGNFYREEKLFDWENNKYMD